MPRFKAFISYKHLTSTRFAENLELALKAYAKPLLRPPTPIFRDEKYLRPAADLPAMISAALAQSEYFIYLASPDAAISPWVQSELQQWCEDDARLKRLIIVLTAGRIVTDDATRRVNWTETNAIPRFLEDRLTTVPLYVDLSWASVEAQQTVLNPDYKKAINSIVAALRNVDPIELSGQEVLQHRRNLRLRNTALGLISGLTILLGVAAWAAWNQAREADRQRINAEARARDATSRRLATQVVRIAEDRPDTALLLTANAFRMGDNAAIRSAWWELLGSRPLTASYLPAGAKDLRFEPGGSLTLDDAARSRVYEQHTGRWVESQGLAATRPFASAAAWTWSGGCNHEEDCGERDAAVWECAAEESKIIGPYGDQDNFCVSSRLHVNEWCGLAAFEVPGFEVSLEQEGVWLRVRTNEGSALYACAKQAPLLVSGDPTFFPSTPTLKLASAGGGSPLRRVSTSFDRRWLAVAREEGNVEIWPIVDEGAQQARRGATVLSLPASAEAIATSPRGAVAIALAPGASGGRGDILFWKDFRQTLAGASPDRDIGDAWRQRGEHGVLVLSADGSHLAAGADVQIRLIDTSSGRTISESYIGRNVATAAQLSSDARRLFLVPQPLDGARSSAAWLFRRPGSAEPLRVGKQISAVAFHPVLADTLITGGGDGMQVWPPPWRLPERKLATYSVDRLAVDAERRLLAASLSDRRVLVQDVDRNATPALSGKREHSATGLAFLSPPPVILWASQAGLEAWDWVDDEWSVIGAAAHRDVQPLPDWYALALSSGRAVIYDLSPERWSGLTCDLVRRNLSVQEWQKFVSRDFPYECACSEYPPGEGSGLKSCN